MVDQNRPFLRLFCILFFQVKKHKNRAHELFRLFLTMCCCQKNKIFSFLINYKSQNRRKSNWFLCFIIRFIGCEKMTNNVSFIIYNMSFILRFWWVQFVEQAEKPACSKIILFFDFKLFFGSKKHWNAKKKQQKTAKTCTKAKHL